MRTYENMTDEELISKYRDGDKQIMDYLMEKYKNLVRKEANAMFLLGGENDDLIQEGMIGLFKAIQDYNEQKEASFYTFARLCVSRQMYSAIEASKRKKHSPLNSYISLYDNDEDQGSLIDQMEASEESNPEELFISQEYAEVLERKLKDSLSDLEKRVLYMYVSGFDYRTIAKLLDKSDKTVDNALQRIRGKMTKILEKGED